MQALHNHIILMGFKHVGKSVIGKSLAERLNSPFIDLDQQTERLHEKQSSEISSCRQIVKDYGETYFRCLEINALRAVLNSKPAIISLGGGTPLHAESERLIKSGLVVHITALRGIVFERILIGGRPAFFVEGEDVLESFNRLWNERNKVYERIRDFAVENTSVHAAVSEIINKIHLEE